MNSPSLRLAFGPKALLAFFCLIMLCGGAHELVHHSVGALVCQAPGHKTFNSFVLAPDCANLPLSMVLSTLAGPLLTFGFMWLGWHRLHAEDIGKRYLGLALIFAQVPIQRVLFAAIGWNDEQYITKVVYELFEADYWQTPHFWLVNLAIWVVVLPPLVGAWRAMEPRCRLGRFVCWFVAPVLALVLVGAVLEEWMLLRMQILATEVWGIPWLLIVAEVVSVIGWIAWRHALIPANARTVVRPQSVVASEAAS